MPIKKEITIHHYTRSAQWPEGEVQVYATVTIDDGSHSVTSSTDQRFTSPRLAAALKNLDNAILAEMGPEAKHVAPLPDERLPQEVRDQLARERGEKASGTPMLANKPG